MKDKEYYENKLVERLKELIGDKGINTFAAEVQISPITIKGWLDKRVVPRTKQLIVISKKYKIKVDYLLGLSD